MATIGEIFAVGLSWRTAPVAVRETLAFRDEELAPTLVGIVAQLPIAEAMLISTCNRVEVYGVAAAGQTGAHAAEALRQHLTALRQAPAEAAQAMYAHAGPAAMQHIFRVASALDSLVVGEAQILGQLKAAYAVAIEQGTAGPLLTRCIERAFAAAKRVRTETAIARGAANVSSVAVELASRVFGDLTGKSVLVVGAGKMSRLAAKHLFTAGAQRVVVTNRSMNKAQALAADIGGIARPWDDLSALLVEADVVISSTGAREPILTHKLFKQITKQRRWRPLMVIDIAVPRDAEPKIADYEGVYLFDIDDLQKVVDNNLSERAKASDDAVRIVHAETAAFEQWLSGQHVVPTIRALRQHVTSIAQIETAKLIEQLDKREHSSAERAEAISRLGQLIANKLLHGPTTALKQASGDVARQRAESISAVFGLVTNDDVEGDAADSEPSTVLPSRVIAQA
jgi:glutamyl-tRNA reductase